MPRYSKIRNCKVNKHDELNRFCVPTVNFRLASWGPKSSLWIFDLFLSISVYFNSYNLTILALGMDYLWDIVTNCDQDDIAERAMELILNTSYLTVSPR